MGDGRSDAGYVSFLVFRLRQNNFSLVFWCAFGISCAISFGICFGDVGLCTYVYGYKYLHEKFNKAPISCMGVMLL